MSDEQKNDQAPDAQAADGVKGTDTTQTPVSPASDHVAEVERLKKELEKVRQEAAGKRIANKEKDGEIEKLTAQVAELGKLAGEVEKIKQSAEAEKKLRAEAEVKALRVSVAAKVGLPVDLAERLRGETPEEIEKDAKELVKLLPAGNRNGFGISPAASANDSGKSMAQQILDRAMKGSGFDLFDPAQSRALGGGVLQTKK